MYSSKFKKLLYLGKMLKPNFKKMYLVSEETFQALTTNLAPGNITNIDNQSDHS